MAISLDLFASRLDHVCSDMEEGMLALKERFDAEIAALDAATEGAEPYEHLAFKAIGGARLADMERRIGQALGG